MDTLEAAAKANVKHWDDAYVSGRHSFATSLTSWTMRAGGWVWWHRSWGMARGL